MKNPLIWLGLAAAGALFFFRKAAVAGAAKILFRGIKLAGSGLKRKIEMRFAVQNASNGAATLRAITGEVFINGQQIADFSRFGDQRIEARSESPLTINAALSGGVISLLTTKGWLKGGVNYEIRGTANFDNFTAPFKYAGKI